MMHTDARLLISFIKPHKSVAKDTIARWVRTLLRMSGIDVSKFSAGSAQPAAASKAGVAAYLLLALWQRHAGLGSLPLQNIIIRTLWLLLTLFRMQY